MEMAQRTSEALVWPLSIQLMVFAAHLRATNTAISFQFTGICHLFQPSQKLLELVDGTVTHFYLFVGELRERVL